jgi:hypothetical protein
MIDTTFEVPAERPDCFAAMYGRPDLIEPQMKFSKAFALWQ